MQVEPYILTNLHACKQNQAISSSFYYFEVKILKKENSKNVISIGLTFDNFQINHPMGFFGGLQDIILMENQLSKNKRLIQK
ncbi:unnamed protein product [Paramecium primaurelia]|uniref:Uncharacterized protein n=1 Tax=Paramecium primaurelia TaxID=5886 RepID=A0A8S1LU21_PARPR|nr:unnamed protein product [Paramecium primaurelia]